MYTSAFICMALAKEKRTRESGGTAPDLFFFLLKTEATFAVKDDAAFAVFDG